MRKAFAGSSPIAAIAWAAIACGVVPWAGCSAQGTPAERTAPIPVSDVRLSVADRAAFDAFLAKQRGKVVLVDFWATWCVPCKELFPHTVDASRRYAGRGVVVVAVSMDDPDKEAEVRAFLASQGATFENFIAQPAPDPFTAFEISGGSLPHFKLYGPDGAIRKTIGSESKSIRETDVDQAVEEVLAGTAGAVP